MMRPFVGDQYAFHNAVRKGAFWFLRIDGSWIDLGVCTGTRQNFIGFDDTSHVFWVATKVRVENRSPIGFALLVKVVNCIEPSSRFASYFRKLPYSLSIFKIFEFLVCSISSLKIVGVFGGWDSTVVFHYFDDSKWGNEFLTGVQYWKRANLNISNLCSLYP